MKYSFIFFLTLTMLFRLNLQAQTTCENALYEADKLFEAGKFNECIELISQCIQSQKNREIKVQSYRLLALSYLNINNDKAAHEYVIKLLKAKPDYQKFSELDPVSFTRMTDGYTVLPKLYGGVTFGFNVGSVALHKSFATYTSAQRYLPTVGFQLGLNGAYVMKRNWMVQTEILYSGVGIKHVIDDASGWEQTISEQQKYFCLQLSLIKKHQISNRVSMYGGIGPGAAWMKRTDVNIESRNIQTEAIQQDSKNGIKERNRFQYSLNGRIGVLFPVNTGNFSIDAGFAYYFRNTVNAEKRLNDLNFIYNNQYINDDLSLRMFMMNVHYQIPIFWEVKAKK